MSSLYHLLAISLELKYFFKRKEFSAICSLLTSLFINSLRLNAHLFISFGGTKIPPFPLNNVSLHAETSDAIICTFAAIASISTFPNPSASVVENAKISAYPIINGIFVLSP